MARLSTARHDRRLAEWQRLTAGGQRLITVQTHHGRLTFASSDSIIGQSLFVERQFERDLMLRTVHVLRRDRLFDPRRRTLVDAGANIGTTTITLLRDRVFDRAVAVEPDPFNFELLERNLRQNSLQDRARCVRVALGDAPGEALLELSPTNLGDHRIRVTSAEGEYGEQDRTTRSVHVERLDTLLRRDDQFGLSRVGLMWMDVQGFEGHVLRGATELIAQEVPVELEFWPYGMTRAGTSPDDYLGLLSSSFARFIDLRSPALLAQPIADAERLYGEYSGPDGATEILLLPG